MADFHQPRFVTTLHALGRPGQPQALPLVTARTRAQGLTTTLVLPALAEEFEGAAFPRILQRLSAASPVSRMIVVLGRATAGQQAQAARQLADMRIPTSLVRLDDALLPAMQLRLRRAGLDVNPEGKGYACWVGICTALAAGSDAVALHDCDIESYEASMVARLLAPIVVPETPFDFAKGYYPRAHARLYGRVTRLLVAPLLRALEALSLPTTLPAFLAEFRYPLAGEVAFSRALVSELPVHAGWGLEIGTLAEVYRRQSRFRVCQVDVAEGYEHRHRCIEPASDRGDLTVMVEQILASLIDSLTRERVCLDARMLRYVLSHYRHEARRLVVAYEADAVVNGLAHDRGAEERTVDGFAAVFERAIANGCRAALPALPSWHAVVQSAPDVALAFADLAVASELPTGDGLDLGWVAPAHLEAVGDLADARLS
jgi:glucosyl-3-phosphoglycerate synthase